MEKKISLLPTCRIQKTFQGKHPLNRDFQFFYSIVGRKKYLTKKDKFLTIKRVAYESLDFGGLTTSSRWTSASGNIIQENGNTKIDLLIQPQAFVRKIFNTVLIVLFLFVLLAAISVKPMGTVMLTLLLLFLLLPWYLMLRSGIQEFKEELEKDIEKF